MTDQRNLHGTVGFGEKGPLGIAVDGVSIVSTPTAGEYQPSLAMPAIITGPQRYHLPDVTVDKFGRVTSINNGTIAISDLPNSGVTAGTYTLSDITVDAEGLVTAASSGVTDLSLAGVGTGGNPLRAFAHYTIWTQSQAVSSNSTGTVLANNRVANTAFNNDTYGTATASLVTGTGVWTCQAAGLYAFEMNVLGPDSNQSGVTSRILLTNAAGLTNHAIASGDIPSDSGTSGHVSSCNCKRTYPMAVNDTVTFQIGSYSGSSRTYEIGCTVTYLGALS